uniref:Septin-type G domain-containing protein n=1 Tax=Rhabditophanes sp. KR3021 TaxID=114890 RepID=A0AC35TQJ4_9BILA
MIIFVDVNGAHKIQLEVAQNEKIETVKRIATFICEGGLQIYISEPNKTEKTCVEVRSSDTLYMAKMKYLQQTNRDLGNAIFMCNEWDAIPDSASVSSSMVVVSGDPEKNVRKEVDLLVESARLEESMIVVPTTTPDTSNSLSFEQNIVVVDEVIETSANEAMIVNAVYIVPDQDLVYESLKSPTSDPYYIEKKYVRIEAKGITEKYIYLNKENKDVIKFNLVDVPGFKETNNISEYLNTISNYIDGRNSPARLNGQQNQLDACLYFLSPHNNCLSEIDKIIMLTIHKKVNIIPIIAKTDIMKFDSIPLVKASIGYDLTANDIETYCFDKQNTGTKTNEPYGIYSHEFFEVAQLIIRHRVMRKNGLRTLPYMYHKEEKQINNYYQLRHHLISTDMLNLIKTTKDKIDLQKNQSFETYGTDSMELLTEDSNSRGRSLEYILRK